MELFSSNISQITTTIIYACMVPFSGLIFILFLIPKNHLFSKVQNRLFILAISVNIFMMLVTILDYALSAAIFPDTWIVRRITSFFNFAFAPIIPLMVFRIFVQKKNRMWVYMPFILNAIVCFASIFTNIVFFIHSDNTYSRGPLFFIPFLVTIFYIFMISWSPANSNRKSKNEERFILVLIMLALVGTMYLEISLRFHCLAYGVCAMGLCVFYLMQNIHYFTTDPLTGAHNRQMYQHAISKIKKSRPSVFALLDINDFKNVNDTYGHDEGDRVLTCFVKILQSNTDKIGDVYRIGGDEFMIISTKSNEKTLTSALINAQKEAGLKNIKFAFGIGEYNYKDDMQEFLRTIDQNMYRAKATMKSETVDSVKEKQNYCGK